MRAFKDGERGLARRRGRGHRRARGGAGRRRRAARPGEVVLLFEAGTDAGIYEDALRALGLPTVRATGRGYYGQQEVGDLLTYLRLLRNRTDDARAAGRAGIAAGGRLERRPGPDPAGHAARGRGRGVRARPAARGALARATTGWPRPSSCATSGWPSGRPGYSLEQLCEAIVAEHDFDLALLARPDGDRRLANVRKLVRLAREYEQLRGPDLEGFVRFCEEQADLAAREGEAAIADEGGEAVVLMTVHSAKGLEFDVVVVADSGRRPGGRGAPDVLVDRDGRVGVRPCPDTGDDAAGAGH